MRIVCLPALVSASRCWTLGRPPRPAAMLEAKTTPLTAVAVAIAITISTEPARNLAQTPRFGGSPTPPFAARGAAVAGAAAAGPSACGGGVTGAGGVLGTAASIL